jgi:hypothetical protein
MPRKGWLRVGCRASGTLVTCIKIQKCFRDSNCIGPNFKTQRVTDLAQLNWFSSSIFKISYCWTASVAIYNYSSCNLVSSWNLFYWNSPKNIRFKDFLLAVYLYLYHRHCPACKHIIVLPLYKTHISVSFDHKNPKHWQKFNKIKKEPKILHFLAQTPDISKKNPLSMRSWSNLHRPPMDTNTIVRLW